MSDKVYFENLKKEDLVAAAEAFGEDPEGTKNQLAVRLVEAGVTEKEHREMFGLDAVKTEDVAPEPEKPVAREDIVTAEPHLEATKNHLVKMERDNPLFEYGKYKFTQQNPYALMTGRDAETLMRTETGFRRAFPSEVEEFYS